MNAAEMGRVHQCLEKSQRWQKHRRQRQQQPLVRVAVSTLLQVPTPVMQTSAVQWEVEALHRYHRSLDRRRKMLKPRAFVLPNGMNISIIYWPIKKEWICFDDLLNTKLVRMAFIRFVLNFYSHAKDLKNIQMKIWCDKLSEPFTGKYYNWIRLEIT